MFSNIIKFLGGNPHKREIQKLSETVEVINSLESEFEKLSDEALRAKTDEFRRRLAEDETLEELLPEAFAAVREASKRTIGLRHYDVQMIGGMALNDKRIAEMRTGEGKTLVATLPLYLNAITGRGVHLVTVNDYLARRDARWMAPVYQALGMSVGVLQMGVRTENGRNAFIVDLEKTSPHEDQHQLRVVIRRDAYKADITYGTNSEFGFDYLRDNLTQTLAERVQRGHYYAIVDEVDNILIDEARTPLIISGPAQDESEFYYRVAQVVRQMVAEDYEIDEKDRTVTLTEAGEIHVEQLLDMSLRDPDRPEDITPEQARMMGFIEQGLRAQFLYKKNKDYLVQANKVVIVDEFTGRLMPGRRWSEGLHQAVEAKEGVKVEAENITYATITLQNYFRMYDKLAGMTGTAETEAEEFAKIYKLEVLPIPTNLEYQAMLDESELKSVEGRDEQGYKYTYYARKEKPDKPLYWKRKDYPDVVYRTNESKLRAMTREIIQFYIAGRPQLVGTTSVEHSELLSDRLNAEAVRRMAQVLLIRDAYLTKHNTDMISGQPEELAPIRKILTDVNVGELRPLARSLGVTSMNPEDAENLTRLIAILGLKDSDKDRLVRALQGGIPHQVLNARRHDEESMIIARAGAFGAVTIATNMAGRGVDIKLGGELQEEILRDTNRVLGRLEDDPFDMNLDERYQALKKTSPADWGIYEESVKAYFQYIEDMRRVRELGGLHVVGSERHEARRIDNQLRGRAARQGDPGSSRFYLSLEDDLMRLFGGAQVENLWKRIMSDDNLPLEVGILGRIVEQSQERVEGSNFDVRKHLLEYDDVLNSQRKRIFSQRDQVFTKEFLSEDVLEMLEQEIQLRVPASLDDEEGPWKLLAFLDETQPSFEFDEISYPSFTYRLIIDELVQPFNNSLPSHDQLMESMLSLAGRAMETERDHTLRSIRSMLEKSQDAMTAQLAERQELLDTFIEGLRDRKDDEDPQPARPLDLLTEASELVRIPFKLQGDNLRALPDGDRDVIGLLRRQVDEYMLALTINRVVLSIERRLGESLNVRLSNLADASFTEIGDEILGAVAAIYAQRMERLLAADGAIAHDLKAELDPNGAEPLSNRKVMLLLGKAAEGTKITFDPRTHQRRPRKFNRLSYVYLAARLLQDADPQEIRQRVSDHLNGALEWMEEARGRAELGRLVQNKLLLSQIDEHRKARLVDAFGLERFEELASLPLEEFSEEDRTAVKETLGEYLQNELYRELLLRVISDQWVEYLTKVEALRVSIGLEAYAQRDPLVQYKARASEMFTALLTDIRSSVVQHVFTYNQRRSAPAAESRPRQDAPVSPAAAPASPPAAGPLAAAFQKQGQVAAKVSDGAQDQNNKAKKKRKRH